MNNYRRSAFTLIELLVVIAIIAILAAILFPVFAQAKVAAKKAVAISNMKQLGMAVMLYAENEDDAAPPRYRLNCGPRTSGGDPSDGMSWDILIQPFTKSYQIIMSNMDSGPLYPSPFGSVRRSYGGAANFFRGYQACAQYNQKAAYSTPPMTYFPQPADTVMIGEERMLNTKGDPTKYWASMDWAAKTGTPGYYNAVFEDTRNINLGGDGSTNCVPNKICKSWCYINNDYAEGSVWAMADGHATYRKGTGKTSDGYNNGTEFKGYEHRAGTWDIDGENNLQWTGGMSCMAWDTQPDPNHYNRNCAVPGETTVQGQ